MTGLAVSLPGVGAFDPDAERMAAAAHGNVDAFNDLVLSHQDFLYGLAVRATGDATLAEDALQDGLFRAYARAGLYRGEGPVRAWLARVVLNACRDAQRWQRRRRAEPLPAAANTIGGDATGDPHREYLVRERARLLHVALNHLGPDQRIALVLYAVHGLEYEEIGVATSAPIGTVKSRIHRARLSLRELMVEHRDLFADA
jgi:RNA polymerase sigma-70 factor (ECF subfamily)